MLPGPTIIRKCSACGKLISQETILSGNTFGARFWTDGKRDAPMLPDSPLLVKCRHCKALVWIDEQEQVGELNGWEAPSDPDVATRFEDVRRAATPAMRDYLKVLAAGVSDPEKEQYLRLRAWWAGNDKRRNIMSPAPLSTAEVRNLRAFVEMLDDADDNDRITKAEVFRELGLFVEADAMLAAPFDDGFAQVVVIIKDLIAQRTTAVEEIVFEGG